MLWVHNGAYPARIVEATTLDIRTRRWGHRADVGTTDWNHQPVYALAESPGGEAVVVWECRPDRPEGVCASVRTPAGPWGPAKLLSPAGAEAELPSVGMDQRGDAIAVWGAQYRDDRFDVAASRIEASTLIPGGAWQQPVVLSRGQFDVDPTLAVAPSGAAAVAWQEEQPDFAPAPPPSYAYAQPNTVQATLRSTTGAGWGAPATLAEEAGIFAAEPAVAINARGEAFVAWQDDQVESNQLLLAAHPAGGAWKAARMIAAWRHVTAPLEPRCSGTACARAIAIRLPGAGPRLLAAEGETVLAWRQAYALRPVLAIGSPAREDALRSARIGRFEGPALTGVPGGALIAWTQFVEATAPDELPTTTIEVAERRFGPAAVRH